MMIHPYLHGVELRIVNKIVGDAIAAGYVVSVYADGDGPAMIKYSHDRLAVVMEMGAAGYDDLVINDATAGHKRVGWIKLVYGNGEDVVSDYSYNPATCALVGDTYEESTYEDNK